MLLVVFYITVKNVKGPLKILHSLILEGPLIKHNNVEEKVLSQLSFYVRKVKTLRANE